MVLQKRFGTLFWCSLILWLMHGCAHETVLTRADIKLYAGVQDGVLPTPADSLVCVSYNIKYSEEMEQSLEDLASDPRLHRPDILLLQEMSAGGTAVLARRLGMNYFYHPSFIHPHHGELFGNAVLSPWPLSNPRNIVLPHPNPMTENRRSALAVDVQVGERKVLAVSIHLATLVVDLEHRVEQLTVVRDSLLQETGPMIVGGDFNSGTQWEVILFSRALREDGFREARLPLVRTARGGPLDLVGYHLKLDHIFYKNLSFVSAGISKETSASDHFPVWSVFRWKN